MSDDFPFHLIKNPEWRDILSRLCDSDNAIREKAFMDATRAGSTEWDGKPSERAPSLSTNDQLNLLKIGMTYPFPAQKNYWEKSEHKIIEPLFCRPNVGYCEVVATNYRCASEPAKLPALVLLSLQKSVQAAAAFIHCIKEGGWPKSVYPKLFHELSHLRQFAKELFPDLIIHADRHLPALTNILNMFLVDGYIKPQDLIPARLHIEQLVANDTEFTRTAQQLNKGFWMLEEEYGMVRARLVAGLDVLGWIPGAATISPSIAIHFTDPRIRLFAMGARLRQGIEPEPSLIESLACDHEVRDDLFYMLKSRRRMDIFPKQHLTFEAFAACDMIQWLARPTELGAPPKSIVIEATLSAKEDGESVLAYLWRFTTDEGKNYSGFSGAYPRKVEPKPVFSNNTFSPYTEWESCGFDEHVKAMLEHFDDWTEYIVIRANN